MSKDDLILLEATPQQYAITIERQLLEWGKLSDSLELSLSQYASREKLLTSSSFGQRFRAWLVPSLLFLRFLTFINTSVFKGF